MSNKRSTLFSYFKPLQEKSLTNKETKKPFSDVDSERENKVPSGIITTPTSTRKRPQINEDSDDDIGVHRVRVSHDRSRDLHDTFQNLSGRRKRVASMSINEKVKMKNKRKKRIFDSSDESGNEY